MKQRYRVAAIVSVILIISISACKKKNTEGRYVPATAHAAFHINLHSLSAKLPWSEIKNNPLFNETDTNGNTWIKNLVDSPALSGIDTDKEIVFFVEQEKTGGYVAIEGHIKDKTVFEKFCTQTSGNATISENEGVNYISRFPACTGWNNERFICVIDAPGLQEHDELNRRMKRDSIDITEHKPRDIYSTCKSIFALPEDQSLAVDEKFSRLLQEEGDMHVWINSGDFYRELVLPGMFSLVNLEKFYKESVTTATVNFDNGRIKINAHSYSGGELAKVYEKFGGGKVSEEMLKRIPGNNVAAAFAVNFKAEALMEIAKSLNLDGIVNGAAPVTGFNATDFVSANKGDMVFGLSDINVITDSVSTEETNLPMSITKPAFDATFAVSVNDKAAFEKLITSAKKASGLFINAAEMPLFYNYNGKYFSLSNSQANADAFVNNAGNNRDFISKITGYPIAGYLNLQTIIKAFGTQAAKDSTGKTVYDLALKTWDEVLLTGGNFSNGALNYSLEINMVDKSTNSLQQLNRFAALLGDIRSKQIKKEQEDIRAMEDALGPSEEPAKK